MILDIEMLRSFYSSYLNRIEIVRQVVRRPLTYAEKVLFAHLYDPKELKVYRRGADYVNFDPTA